MRIRRASEGSDSLIDIAPMVDIMFTLIIFFLATTTFEKEERDVKVNLPESSKSSTLSAAPKVVVINVREDGSYYLGNQAVQLTELQRLMVEAVENKADQKVLIRGDQPSQNSQKRGRKCAKIPARVGIAEAQ